MNRKFNIALAVIFTLAMVISLFSTLIVNKTYDYGFTAIFTEANGTFNNHTNNATVTDGYDISGTHSYNLLNLQSILFAFYNVMVIGSINYIYFTDAAHGIKVPYAMLVYMMLPVLIFFSAMSVATNNRPNNPIIKFGFNGKDPSARLCTQGKLYYIPTSITNVNCYQLGLGSFELAQVCCATMHTNSNFTYGYYWISAITCIMMPFYMVLMDQLLKDNLQRQRVASAYQTYHRTDIGAGQVYDRF